LTTNPFQLCLLLRAYERFLPLVRTQLFLWWSRRPHQKLRKDLQIFSEMT